MALGAEGHVSGPGDGQCGGTRWWEQGEADPFLAPAPWGTAGPRDPSLVPGGLVEHDGWVGHTYAVFP